MIISFNGDHGSGKSTIAKKIAQDLNYEYYYTGNIFRSMAKEKGMAYVQFLELMDQDSSIDREVDDKTALIGKTKDNLVFDSRMAWHFIPHSLKIFLKADENEAAKRMFLHLKKERSDQRINEDKQIESPEDILKSNKHRKESDSRRYQTLYGVDIWDERNYDYVLDTTKLEIEEVHQKILEFLKRCQTKKE